MRSASVIYTVLIIFGFSTYPKHSVAKTQEECESEYEAINSEVPQRIDAVVRENEKLKRRLSDTGSAKLVTTDYCAAVISWKSSATSGLRWAKGPCGTLCHH